jgi:hypothetical protein
MGRYSFDVIGEHNGAVLIYTCPSRVDIPNSDTDIAGFRACFAPYMARPWIWIVDCAGMTAVHVANQRFVRAIYNMIETEHATSLQHVWLLNMNSIMRAVLHMFPAKRLTVLPRDRLEIFVALQRAGYSHATVDLFLAIAGISPPTPSQIRQ